MSLIFTDTILPSKKEKTKEKTKEKKKKKRRSLLQECIPLILTQHKLPFIDDICEN